MVQALTDSEFAGFVKDNKVVLVDFTATWCGPCQMLKPIIAELATEYDGKAAVVAVDIDSNQQVAQTYGIQAVPTVIFFKDGEVAEQMMGLNPKPTYAKVLDKLLG